MTHVRYARAPSGGFLTDLQGWLSPVLAPPPAAGVQVDVHLRENDVLALYAGGARVVALAWRAGAVTVSAHKTYATQPCAAPFIGRAWQAGGEFFPRLRAYLAAVQVKPSDLGGEGAVQSAWSRVTHPWTPIDREAVLGYQDGDVRMESRRFPAVQAARRAVATVGRSWKTLDPDKVYGELDQIGIDDAGQLVLLELKDAAAKSSDGVYYSPLQALQYAWEWSSALPSIRDDLLALRRARIQLGLTPATTADLGHNLRVAVGFGREKSSIEVRERFDLVLAICQQFLPPGVHEMEAWRLPGSAACRVRQADGRPLGRPKT